MDKRRSSTGRVGVSRNGRCFVDEAGRPFFWLGDTQWELFRSYSLSEAEAIIRNRIRKGFTVVQVMLLGVDPEKNIEGELPWEGGDPLRPNGRYFRHVDEVIALNSKLGGPVLVIGVFHATRMKGVFDERNARPWAEWVSRRYGRVPDIIWSMYPRAVGEDVPVSKELAAGLRAGDGGTHLITVHPDPSPASSSSILHKEDWLAFNSIQTFKNVELIRPMVENDRRLSPTRPVVMAEGAYEAGIEYGFDVTPLWTRRQAYYSYLSGGHHSYGHNDSWRVLPSWREALDAPGAAQMSVLRETLEGLDEWWEMTPDQSLLRGDCRVKEGRILNLAARHREGKWAIAYAAAPGELSLDLDSLPGAGRTDARWVDPRSGDSLPAGEIGGRPLHTPEDWEDALLVVTDGL